MDRRQNLPNTDRPKGIDQEALQLACVKVSLTILKRACSYGETLLTPVLRGPPLP